MYANYLKSFKIYFRDFLKEPNEIIDFKFPKRQFKPKILPSKTALKQFYDALDPREQTIFLLLGESGLRISELLNCTVDKSNKMLIPNGHTGQTKHSYISFYQTEIDEIPKISIRRIEYFFNKASELTDIKIKPHTLRSIFTREMSKAGVQDRYIDCFCGRVPVSVLARHYSDFSPETLKEIYLRANIQIL